MLDPWPVERPRRWLDLVNQPQTDAEEDAMKLHIRRSRPLGGDAWIEKVVKSLGLQQTVRPRGRPPGWRTKTRMGQARK